MRYIDKSLDIAEGHTLSNQYLESYCKLTEVNGSYSYINVDYDGSFTSSGAKAQIQQLALKNQAYLCCYCMRDLHLQNQLVTLEHIIPQNCSEHDFKEYIELGVKNLTTHDVIRTAEFAGVNEIRTPPYPHTIAFENLVASCDGTFPDREGTSQCCNHKRGNRFVYPMFYKEDISDNIRYMQDGTMQPRLQCNNEMFYMDTINNTRLNCQILKDIRRLWHLYRETSYKELVTYLGDKDGRKKSLSSILYKNPNLMEQDARIGGKFMLNAYWRTFLLYHWFHGKL